MKKNGKHCDCMFRQNEYCQTLGHKGCPVSHHQNGLAVPTLMMGIGTTNERACSIGCTTVTLGDRPSLGCLTNAFPAADCGRHLDNGTPYPAMATTFAFGRVTLSTDLSLANELNDVAVLHTHLDINPIAVDQSFVVRPTDSIVSRIPFLHDRSTQCKPLFLSDCSQSF